MVVEAVAGGYVDACNVARLGQVMVVEAVMGGRCRAKMLVVPRTKVESLVLRGKKNTSRTISNGGEVEVARLQFCVCGVSGICRCLCDVETPSQSSRLV
jgi:hypothetical protein